LHIESLDNVSYSGSVMDPVPDRVTLRRLRDYDPELNIGWNRNTKRWVVTGRNYQKAGKREHIMTVQNEDRTYRPLDDRILVNLMLADAFRHDDLAHFTKILNENDRAVDRNQAQELSNAFRERNEELYRSFFGSPTVAPAGGWKEF